MLSNAHLASADIIIGVASSRAQPYSELSSRLDQQVADKIASLNAAGAFGTESFRIVPVDDGCDRATATTIAQSLVAQKVDLVLGHPCTPAALAAAEIYAANNIVFLATFTRHPSLTDKRDGGTIFRVNGRDDGLGNALGRILAAASASGPVAIISDRSQYATRVAKDVEKVIRQNGRGEPLTATIIGGDKDYTRTVEKIASAQTIAFAGFPMEAGLFYKALRASGNTARVIATDTITSDEFGNTFGRDVREIETIVASENLQAVGTALEVYAAARERAAPATGGTAIATALRAKPFALDTGPISFAKNGDAETIGYDVLRWNGEAWLPIEASSQR